MAMEVLFKRSPFILQFIIPFFVLVAWSDADPFNATWSSTRANDTVPTSASSVNQNVSGYYSVWKDYVDTTGNSTDNTQNMTGETSQNTVVSADSLNSNTTMSSQGKDYPLDTAIIVLIAAACALIISIIAIIFWWIFWRREHSCGDCACMENCASDMEEDRKSLSNFEKDKEMFEIPSSTISHRDTVIEEQEQSFDFDAETKSLGMNTMARRENVYDQRMQLMQELFQSLDKDPENHGSLKLLPKLHNKDNGEVLHNQESTGLSLLMSLNNVQPSSPSLSKLNEASVNVIPNLKVTSSLPTQANAGFSLTQSIISDTPPSKQTEAGKDLFEGSKYDMTFAKPAKSSVSLPNNVMSVTPSHKSAESGVSVPQTVASDTPVPIQAEISKSLHEKMKSDPTVTTQDDTGNKLSKKTDIGNKLSETIISDKESHKPVETTMSWSRNVTPDPPLLHQAGTGNNSLDKTHAASATHKPVETSTSWSRSILSDEPSLQSARASYNSLELAKSDPSSPKLAEPSMKGLEFDTISAELSKTDISFPETNKSELLLTKSVENSNSLFEDITCKSAEISADLSKSTMLGSSSAKLSATDAKLFQSVTPDSPTKINERLSESIRQNLPSPKTAKTDANLSRSLTPQQSDTIMNKSLALNSPSSKPVENHNSLSVTEDKDALAPKAPNTSMSSHESFIFDPPSHKPFEISADLTKTTTPDSHSPKSILTNKNSLLSITSHSPSSKTAENSNTLPDSTEHDTLSTTPANTDISYSADSDDSTEKIHDKQERNSALLASATDVLDTFDEFLQSSDEGNEIPSIDEITHF